MADRYEELFLPEQREEIVRKVVSALKAERQLSNNSINRFRNILKEGKPIPGFNKDPIKALPRMLEQSILERMNKIAPFECVVAELWAETESALREAVTERLDELDAQVFADDEIDEDFWNAQVRLLADRHGEYEEDDILLMMKLCYTHAKIQAKLEATVADFSDADSETTEVAMDTASGALSDIMARLRNLPAESGDWDEEIPRFAQALNDLIDAKAEERNRISNLLDDLKALQNESASELEFFGRGADSWDIANLATIADISEASRLLDELKATLETYQGITERADTLVAERERREKRHELEVDIEAKLNEIDELSQSAAAETEPSSDALSLPTPQPEADPELLEALDTLRSEHEILREKNHALTQDADSLSEANRTLQGEVTGLNADKQALAGEVAELRDQLQISERQELYWRQVYEAEMSSKDSTAPDPIPSEFESVRQAVALARTRYRDRLVFRLNKKSDPDYDYTRPKEVWDALEWLATTYYKAQAGEIRVTNLNESIRSACSGWEYKSDQNDITFNMYREWYTTSKNGVPYELRKHLSKGTGRDRNVIRIAFEWDEATDTVLIGYIGPHQRSRAS